MVKTFEQQEITGVTIDKLSLNPGDINGDFISGGTIKKFASTGIEDRATSQTLVVENDRIFVKHAVIESIDANLKIRGDVKIYGVLDVGMVRTMELISNHRHEKQYLTFAGPEGDAGGSGLLWECPDSNKQFVYRSNPNRFWSTEHLDLLGEKNYLIEGQVVLSATELGRGIVSSSLKKLGTLDSLNVAGNATFGDFVRFNPVSQRVSIGTEDANGSLTIYDYANDVELIFDSNSDGLGLIGTFNTKGLGIVTDNQIRLTVEVNGDITVGHEQKDGNITRIYGKLGVGVKNPREQFEVAGNMRVGNRLFSQGNAVPDHGNYQKGDIVWNTDPKEGSYIGWVCTAGGAPGLWKPFGMIGA
jgi:hypothetical protein